MDDFNFDDDVFISKAERQMPEQEPYEAKQEPHGWFHEFDSYETLMQERHGPNQLKSAIEHDYLYKRYDKALAGALKFIELTRAKQSKVSSTREMSEIAIHCALRLGRLDLAEQLVDEKQASFETGSLLLEARVYALCGRPGDALAALVRYHALRKLDYNAWHLLARIVQDTKSDNSMRNHVAKLAIQRAIRIMTSSHWPLHIDHVKRRYERELVQLEALASQVQDSDPCKFIAWAKAGPITQERTAQVGLEVFACEDIEFIYQQTAKYYGESAAVSVEDEEEDNSTEIRNPRDL
ncbi:hypothetical protein BX666DRAFT_177737 [Dichotomocladium elegans]|nr:hypothetical protein BX666DRAFT_177737 [Dichotomocladium elegans]